MAIEMEPMSSSELDKSIIRYFPSADIVSRAAAKIATPLTNDVLKDVSGVDHVVYLLNNEKSEIFQCVFCGLIYSSPTSVRGHLVKHSNDKQTAVRDTKAIADAVNENRSIYAPYDTDEENVTFMMRVTRGNEPALGRIIKKAKASTTRVNGRTAVETDELKTLKAKAKAYDALKAQTLKSQFPV